MDRRWLIAGGIALAAVALVAASVLTRPHATAPAPVTPAATSSSESSAPSAAASAGSPTWLSGSQRQPTAASPGAGAAAPTMPGASASNLAAVGKPLVAVPRPPEHTLAMVSTSAARDGETYNVTFRPYGTGPGQTSLVVLVSASAPVVPRANAVALTGRNVLIATSSRARVSAGGTYSGTLRLVRNGDTLSFVLTSVRRQK